MEIAEMIEKCRQAEKWQFPQMKENIPHGDMPGDKISVDEDHVRKAKLIFRELVKLLPEVLANSKKGKAVITICGGSGVGKSEIASILNYYFNELGLKGYTLSGDNYPRRIPMYNDAERLRIFRESGLRNMIHEGVYTSERFLVVQQLQKEGKDADPSYQEKYDWFRAYLDGGREGLERYLGTPEEINYTELERIVWNFKEGADKIWLKRMGRDDTAMWFDEVDFRNTSLLFVEWTHGNSEFYQGVDIPVLLNSTPKETLEHRRKRNRDGQTDSPFTTLVLNIEQQELREQAHKARIIVSKQGELLDYEQYQTLMGKE